MKIFAYNYGGKMEIIYHRTGKYGLDSVSKLLNEGFKPGGGAMYGRGLYGCTDLESQEESKMSGYGDFLIEFAINSQNIIDLNNKEESIKKITALPRDPKTKKTGDKNKISEKNFAIKRINEHQGIYTSEVALSIWPFIMKNFDGVMFTGRHDGNVCVIYNYTKAKILRVLDGTGKHMVANSKAITKNLQNTMFVLAQGKAKNFFNKERWMEIIDLDKSFEGKIIPSLQQMVKENYDNILGIAANYIINNNFTYFDILNKICEGKLSNDPQLKESTFLAAKSNAIKDFKNGYLNSLEKLIEMYGNKDDILDELIEYATINSKKFLTPNNVQFSIPSFQQLINIFKLSKKSHEILNDNNVLELVKKTSFYLIDTDNIKDFKLLNSIYDNKLYLDDNIRKKVYELAGEALLYGNENKFNQLDISFGGELANNRNKILENIYPEAKIFAESYMKEGHWDLKSLKRINDLYDGRLAKEQDIFTKALKLAGNFLSSGSLPLFVAIDDIFSGEIAKNSEEILKDSYPQAIKHAEIYLNNGNLKSFNDINRIYRGRLQQDKEQIMKNGYQSALRNACAHLLNAHVDPDNFERFSKINQAYDNTIIKDPKVFDYAKALMISGIKNENIETISGVIKTFFGEKSLVEKLYPIAREESKALINNKPLATKILEMLNEAFGGKLKEEKSTIVDEKFKSILNLAKVYLSQGNITEFKKLDANNNFKISQNESFLEECYPRVKMLANRLLLTNNTELFLQLDNVFKGKLKQDKDLIKIFENKYPTIFSSSKKASWYIKEKTIYS